MLLRGLNVVEIPGAGAAGWATKDLAGWGANVVVLERVAGTPLRREAPPTPRLARRPPAREPCLTPL